MGECGLGTRNGRWGTVMMGGAVRGQHLAVCRGRLISAVAHASSPNLHTLSCGRSAQARGVRQLNGTYYAFSVIGPQRYRPSTVIAVLVPAVEEENTGDGFQFPEADAHDISFPNADKYPHTSKYDKRQLPIRRKVDFDGAVEDANNHQLCLDIYELYYRAA